VARAHLHPHLLGDARPLPLSPPQVATLAARWGGPTSRRGKAWADIAALAAHFLDCDARSAPLAWHHLLLAVGNSKRRGGLILPPNLGAVEQVQADKCMIPGVGDNRRPLSREDQATWVKLTDTPGIGVSTAPPCYPRCFRAAM
jgi:hypothetical protein